MLTVGFIGTGNMGGALAKAVASVGEFRVLLSDKSSDRALALAKEINAEAADNKSVIAESDFIFIGLKPQVLPAVLKELSGEFSSRKSKFVIVSMAAGVTISRILELLGNDLPLIRILPNTPVSVGEGVIQYTYNSEISKDDINSFISVLSKAGKLFEVSEKMIDAGCAVAGCGPAFVDMFIEALADGGVACGLPMNLAMQFAEQTVLGTAKLAIETAKHPEILKDEVCSPGGSTIQGVRVLEDKAFRSAVMNAVISSYEKTQQLG